jgi:hypothetical protein
MCDVKWYPRIRAGYKVYECHAFPIGDVRDFEDQEFVALSEHAAIVATKDAKIIELDHAHGCYVELCERQKKEIADLKQKLFWAENKGMTTP